MRGLRAQRRRLRPSVTRLLRGLDRGREQPRDRACLWSAASSRESSATRLRRSRAASRADALGLLARRALKRIAARGRDRQARRSIRRTSFPTPTARHRPRRPARPTSLRRLSPASRSRRKAAASLVSRSSAASESAASWRSRAMSSLNCTSRCVELGDALLGAGLFAVQRLARDNKPMQGGAGPASASRSGGNAACAVSWRLRGFGLRQRRGRHRRARRASRARSDSATSALALTQRRWNSVASCLRTCADTVR